MSGEPSTLFDVVPDTRHGHYGESLYVVPDERKGRVRNTDPETSAAGAASVAYRAGSQKARLLSAFAAAGRGLTDEEAAEAVGLLRSEFSKRCGELREDGMLALTGETRAGASGVQRIVSTITDAGRAVAGMR